MSKENSRATTVAGLALAGAGLAHFVVPQLFEGLTKPAFPSNTRQHVYIDGGIEVSREVEIESGGNSFTQDIENAAFAAGGVRLRF